MDGELNIVERIKALCESRGLTLTSLENVLKLGTSTIRRWDAQKPSIDKVLKVAQHFDVSLDYLLGCNQHDMFGNATPDELTMMHRVATELSEQDRARLRAILEVFLNSTDKNTLF